MPEAKISKTGNAPIIRQGHSSNGEYGDDPDYRAEYGNTSPGSEGERDLKPK